MTNEGVMVELWLTIVVLIVVGVASLVVSAYRHRQAATSASEAVDEADRPAYASLHVRLMAELRPRGHLQTILAEQVVQAAWRLTQAHRVEEGLYALGDVNPIMRAVLRQSDVSIDRKALAFSGQSAEIVNASRYVATAERSFHQALAAYRQAQKRSSSDAS